MGQINCICLDCDKTAKFKDLSEARSSKWAIWGIHMRNNEYYASCPQCDTTILPNKPIIVDTLKKTEELINSSAISYD